jgi:hypothetical protein
MRFTEAESLYQRSAFSEAEANSLEQLAEMIWEMGESISAVAQTGAQAEVDARVAELDGWAATYIAAVERGFGRFSRSNVAVVALIVGGVAAATAAGVWFFRKSR